MDFSDDFELTNFNGNSDYKRIIEFSNPLQLIECKFKHTPYYNTKENAFITIPDNTIINSIDTTNSDVIKFEDRKDFMDKLIKYIEKTKNNNKENKCIICLDNNIGLYMPCCNFKQFICKQCINHIYINDNYNCPCCRKMYMLKLQKQFNLITVI